MMQSYKALGALTWTIALTAVACGSYDESSGLIEMGGTGALPDIRINELMARNPSGSDWIELYNSADREVSLAGYYVSDTADALYRARLPVEAVVPAEGFLVLYADDDTTQGGLHLGFKLSGDGEGVWLTSADGRIVDSVTFGSDGPAGSSYARYPDGGDVDVDGTWEWCSTPTQGRSNGEGCEP